MSLKYTYNKIDNIINNNDIKIVSLLIYNKKIYKKCKRCGRYEHNELECIETTYINGDKIISIEDYK